MSSMPIHPSSIKTAVRSSARGELTGRLWLQGPVDSGVTDSQFRGPKYPNNMEYLGFSSRLLLRWRFDTSYLGSWVVGIATVAVAEYVPCRCFDNWG